MLLTILRNSLPLYNKETFKYVHIRASTRPTDTTNLTQDYMSIIDIQLKQGRISKLVFDSCLHHCIQTCCDSASFVLLLGLIYLRNIWLH